MASDVTDQREWLKQWTSAAVALADQRKKDLREMSDGQALAASEALLSLVTTVTLNQSRRTHSGLVEQQALFRRRATK